MKDHIGKTVTIPGEKGTAKVLDYRGKNKHGTPMFLVELPSKATRLYSGQRLLAPTTHTKTDAPLTRSA